MNSLNYKSKIYYALIITGVVYFLYIILFCYTTGNNLEAFPDSLDYKIQSEISLFSLDFFVPKPTNYFTPRPFTIPLIYKIVNSNPYNMVIFQKIIYCVCVFILIFSIINHLENSIIKIISFYLLLYFFTWWNIVGWSNIILSEFLSISFMFLWFGSILFYFKNQSNINLILLIISSIILSFTRDTWPYIIIIFSVLNILLTNKYGSIKKNLVLIIFSVLLFLIQNYTSNIGERYKIPLFNTIAGRISQNSEYTDWFKKEGMPLTKNIISDFKGVNIDDDDSRQIVYSKYQDTTYIKLFNWILKDGKKSYQKFMVSHLGYFFLADQTETQKRKIFQTTLLGYIQKPKGFYLKADGTFPYFTINIIVFLLFPLLMLFFRKKEKILLFPLILIVLFAMNALILYNADALEVCRHLFVTQIVLDFIGLISILLILDNLISIFINSNNKSILLLKSRIRCFFI